MMVKLTNELRRAYENIVRIRQRDDLTFDEFDSLITAAAMVRIKLEDMQQMLSRACAPWFEVK